MNSPLNFDPSTAIPPRYSVVAMGKYAAIVMLFLAGCSTDMKVNSDGTCSGGPFYYQESERNFWCDHALAVQGQAEDMQRNREAQEKLAATQLEQQRKVEAEASANLKARENEVETYRKAAELGDALAQFHLGAAYFTGQGVEKNYAQAVLWFQKSANQGNAKAQAMLGVVYSEDNGVPQDYKKAAEWYGKAAEQGNDIAQLFLGNLHVNGNGVPQDYKKAAKWYRKAAEQGNAAAQSNLAAMYYNGLGVSLDYDKSVEWYIKAAKQGNSEATKNLPIAEAALKHHLQDIAIAEQQEVLKSQMKEDESRGYKYISIEDYQLDANTMRLGQKLIVTGYYEVEGNYQTLSQYPTITISNGYKINVLTDNSPRSARKKLIDLQRSMPCARYRPCSLTLLGHITSCRHTYMGMKVRDTVCLDVDDIR